MVAVDWADAGDLVRAMELKSLGATGFCGVLGHFRVVSVVRSCGGGKFFNVTWITGGSTASPETRISQMNTNWEGTFLTAKYRKYAKDGRGTLTRIARIDANYGRDIFNRKDP